MRAGATTAAAVLLTGAGIATATAAPPLQGRGGIGNAYSVTVGPVVLPATAACWASRTLRIQLHHSAGRRPVLLGLRVAGRRLEPRRYERRHGAVVVPVPAAGAYTISVSFRLGHVPSARGATVHARYRACAGG
jgi:hypothetical protein